MKWETLQEELDFKIKELESYERKLKQLGNEYHYNLYTGMSGYYKEIIHKTKIRINQIKQKI